MFFSTPENIDNVLSKIRLTRLAENIYAIKIKDPILLANLFMRHQEYYESDIEEIRGQEFTMEQFVQAYKTRMSNDNFTYYLDWGGFNVPGHVLNESISITKDINFYDKVMHIINKKIGELSPENFYLIGMSPDSTQTLRHEIAHALWFLDSDYKQKQLTNIQTISSETKEEISNILLDMGYCQPVIDDEIQAYFSTGLLPEMRRIEPCSKLSVQFRKTFDDFFRLEKEIDITPDWTDEAKIYSFV